MNEEHLKANLDLARRQREEIKDAFWKSIRTNKSDIGSLFDAIADLNYSINRLDKRLSKLEMNEQECNNTCPSEEKKVQEQQAE